MKVARVRSRTVSIVLLSLLAAGGCAPVDDRPDGRVVDMRPDRPDVDEDAGDIGDCEPPYAPGRFVYTRTWPEAELVALALDSTGAAVVGGVFTRSTDLDPGPGVMMHPGDPGIEYSFVARLDPAGALDWVRVLDPSLDLRTLAITTEDRVVLTGRFQHGNVTSFDFDPGPGTAMEPVAPHTQGMYVTALARDGAYAWSRATGPGSYPGAATTVAARPAGRVLVAGGAGQSVSAAGGAIGPGAGLVASSGFLLYLDRDGVTEAVLFPGMATVSGAAVSPDGTVAAFGVNGGTWDADHTYGVDEHVSNAIFTTQAAPAVTQVGPDLAYRWTRSWWDPVRIRHIAVDASGSVFVSGGVDPGPALPEAVDLDPGPDWRWLRPGGFMSALTAEGELSWAGHPEAIAGRALRGDARGFYTATNAVVELMPTRHAAKIGAFETDGHRRYWLTLGSTGDSMATEIAVGPGTLRAVGGYFRGGIDHAFGGAPPDPHESVATELPGDAFVTLFTDEGGTAPRCSDAERVELPRWICPSTRNIRCEELHVECGQLTDPCVGGVVECGDCVAPETCGGGGVPNMCGRETPLVLADGLNHPMHLGVDDTHVYFTTFGDLGTIVVRTVPGADAGTPETPVEEGVRLWRVPRDGGAVEMLYQAQARPNELFVGVSAVYLRTEAPHFATGTNEVLLLRFPKSDPSAVSPFLIDGEPSTPYAIHEGYLYASGAGGVVRLLEDGSGATEIVIPSGSWTRGELFFDAGEVFYVGREGTEGDLTSVRSRPSGGGPEIVRSTSFENGRVHRVDASGILISTGGGIGFEEWYLLPRSATGAEAGTFLGEWPRDSVLGGYVTVDGEDQIFLHPGPRSADTREGALWSIPVGAMTPQRRIATGLNHPRAIAIDDGYMWIVEEGSLATRGANGRILRALR